MVHIGIKKINVISERMADNEIRMGRDHGCRRLGGKVAIVTASTLGIGRAIVQRLAEEGEEEGQKRRPAREPGEGMQNLTVNTVVPIPDSTVCAGTCRRAPPPFTPPLFPTHAAL